MKTVFLWLIIGLVAFGVYKCIDSNESLSAEADDESSYIESAPVEEVVVIDTALYNSKMKKLKELSAEIKEKKRKEALIAEQKPAKQKTAETKTPVTDNTVNTVNTNTANTVKSNDCTNLNRWVKTMQSLAPITMNELMSLSGTSLTSNLLTIEYSVDGLAYYGTELSLVKDAVIPMTFSTDTDDSEINAFVSKIIKEILDNGLSIRTIFIDISNNSNKKTFTVTSDELKQIF